MIDRFTEKAREAIQTAAELAAQLDHGYVGTEHLLLGLIREGTGVAAMILGHYGVTEEKVLSLMERLISPRLPPPEYRENWSIHRAPDRCWKPAMRRLFCLKRL